MGKVAREIFNKLGTPKNISEWDNSEFALAAAMKDNDIAFHSFKKIDAISIFLLKKL